MTAAPRRLHSRGILARSWGAVALAVVYAEQRRGSGGFSLRDDELGIAAIVVATLVLQTIVWRVTTFAVDADAVSIRSGLLVRQTRHLRLDRLQAVDVVRPLAARVLGLTELRIEVAGAGRSRVSLRYLSAADAEEVRAQILRLASGAGPREGLAAVVAPTPGEPFFVVPNPLVLGGFLLSHPLVVLAIPLGILAWLAGFVTAATFGGLAAAALSVLESLRRATGWANFRITDAPDGMHLRRGLLDTRAQTVPRGRVHAVSIVQPLLWRAFDWVRVEVTIAGYGHHEKEHPGVLLPVAPMPVALALVRRLYPSVDLATVLLQPVPSRARWRAPLVGRRYGAAVAGEHFLTRHGVLTRTTSVVPTRRIQSVHVLQGPWQRALGLASVRADIAPGPVASVARHLDARAAQQLAIVLTDLARRSERRVDADGLHEPHEAAEAGRIEQRSGAGHGS